MAAIAAAVALGIATRLLRPFLIASHPVGLVLVDGGAVTIAAAGALARVGEIPTWQVLLAGPIGIAKLNWLTWWAGRRWGAGIMRFFTRSARAEALSQRVSGWRPRTLRIAVVAASIPGVPSAIVFALAGHARMPLRTFLVLDLTGALLLTSAMIALGNAAGQPAVDLVLLVERHAGWISLGLLAAMVIAPSARRAAQRVTARRPRCEPSDSRSNETPQTEDTA